MLFSRVLMEQALHCGFGVWKFGEMHGVSIGSIGVLIVVTPGVLNGGPTC